jgi:hypothetical protein
VAVGVLPDFGVDLFLLPGGRPRRFLVISDIHAGGRPGPRLTLLASRSKLKTGSSPATNDVGLTVATCRIARDSEQ